MLPGGGILIGSTEVLPVRGAPGHVARYVRDAAQWLNEILYAATVEGFLFSSADLRLENGRLSANVRGQSGGRSLLATELKSVTYHDLRLQKHDYGWYAHVVVDV